MLKANVDPRIQRTRKLIMDSFIDLSTRKDFNAFENPWLCQGFRKA